MYEVRDYVTATGKDVYKDWRKKLRDHKAALAVDRRLYRMALGNFGDHKFLRDGVYELKMDVGPGYRLYYAMDGQRSSFSSAQETSGRRKPTSTVLASTGRIGSNVPGRTKMKAKTKHARDRSHDDAMAEIFQQDPAYAVALLNDILQDGEQGELLIALRQMTKAFGGIAAVAEKANLNPTQLYRTLSEEGNPTVSSLAGILKTMGLRLAVERVNAEAG